MTTKNPFSLSNKSRKTFKRYAENAKKVIDKHEGVYYDIFICVCETSVSGFVHHFMRKQVKF